MHSKTNNPVLDAVRFHLARSDREAVGLPDAPNRPTPSGNLVDLFATQLELAGGVCTRAKNLVEANGYITELRAANNLTRLATSDGLFVQEVMKISDTAEDRDELFVADAGLTDAQWGIAETGTLVLASGAERHRLTSLVPPIHIALLASSSIVGTMQNVLGILESAEREHQAITLITGPSRTADIELTLVVGVHGPKELHVVVLLDH